MSATDTGDLPLTPSCAAKTRLSPRQKVTALLLAAALIITAVQSFASAMKVIVVVNLAYAGGFLALRFTAILTHMLRTKTDLEVLQPPECLPVISVLCPLYKERESVGRLIDALLLTAYPHDKLDLIVLLEEDDLETEDGITTRHPSLRVLRVPEGGQRTKPNALNHGLQHAKGDIIGIYDAEDRPERDQLFKIATAFAQGPEELACVQAALNHYNRDDTIITRLFCLEYALQFDWFLNGLSHLGLPLPLGGTSNFIKRDALLHAGGWDPYNVTEDADLGLRLSSLGYQSRTVASSTYEEATDTPRRWIKQRSRWLKGFMQTYCVHLRRCLSWKEAATVHLAIGAVFINALINPWMWAAFAFWVITKTEALDPIFGGALAVPLFLAFIVGNMANAWFLIMAPMERGWFSLAPSGLMLPLYWIMQSVAAYKAAYEFCVRPFYWDKTEHSAGEDSLREVSDAAA